MNDRDLSVKGLADLQALLDTLPAKMERNVLRGGMRAGMNEVKPVAQANIHSRSGALAASLKVRTNARGGDLTASLYSRDFTARFIEYGTKPHTITAKNRKGLSIGGLFFQSVQHPGSRGIGFMRNALDVQAQPAVVALGNYIKDRLATKEGLDTAYITVEGDE